MQQIKGTVKNIIYRNDENGYTVLELVDASGDDITAVGMMPLANIGERIEIDGDWAEHRAYGMQFKAADCRTLAPATLTTLISYLGSGLIRGVGESTAKAIVATFGMDTLEVMENQPERLTDVPGIGRVKAKTITESFQSQKDMRDIMLALQAFGVTVSQATKLYSIYDKLCLTKIQENPYRMIDDVDGIGFITADKIALNAGIAPDSSFRLKAGLKYTLNWARQEGHTYLPREKLIEVAADILSADILPVERTLDELILASEVVYKIVNGVDAVFLPYMNYIESDCAKRLHFISRPLVHNPFLDADSRIERLEERYNITLAPNQREAVKTALKSGAMVITGGPGTGKTTILRFIIGIVESLSLDYELCAPTGRAAKRMTEASGVDARTIHRLLEYDPRDGGFKRNEDNPLTTDMIIVDEMSMVDVMLMHALLKAVGGETRLIMVGDADQLPPVGPGNVLQDIIASGTIPVIRLNDIFRQSERGMIVENAHRINRGVLPELYSGESDFMFEEMDTAEETARRVIGLCAGRTNKLLTRDCQKDVQVLAPMKKGALGIVSLNQRLQAALNPSDGKKAELKYGSVIFREGDKIMQVKNNYRVEWERLRRGGQADAGLGVFNGDLGTIMRIDAENRQLKILFDDERSSIYDFDMLDEIELAYAVTVHKSQGSEFPIVIMPLFGGVSVLMTRNLLYTAVTRARDQVYILGRSETVYGMARNAQMKKRYSALCAYLTEFGNAYMGMKR